MKKNIKYILALSVAPMMLASCDDMLNKHPQATLSPETFFTNESEMMSFSNSFYTIFPSTGLYNENCDNYIGIDLISEIRDGRVIPGSGSGWSFTDLRKFNTLLDYSGNCKDEKVRNRYVGLARFFRAYFYFEKVKRFGDVPWYDKELGSTDSTLFNPRDSRELIMSHMIEDIDEAIESLPSDVSVYRVNKWAACMLKAQFCLYEGTFRKYHGLSFQGGRSADDYLKLAYEAAQKVMESGKYSLAANYHDLFMEVDADKNEYILAIKMEQSIGCTHNATGYVLMNTGGNPGFSKKFVDSFLMKDGSRFTDKEGW